VPGGLTTRHLCCYKTPLICNPVGRKHFELIVIKDRKRLANQKARPFPCEAADNPKIKILGCTIRSGIYNAGG